MSEYTLSPRPYRFTLIETQTPEPFRTRFEFAVNRPLETPLRVTRERVLGSQLHETYRVQNPENVQTSLRLRLGFHADFADTFEVRGMVPPRRRVPRTELSGRTVLFSRKGTDGILRWTRLTFNPLPNRLSRSRVVWDLYLPPRSETVLAAQVETGTGNPPRERRLVPLNAVARKVRQARSDQHAGWGRVISPSPLADWTGQATEDLLTLLIDVDGFQVPAAGLPWYGTLFGRDSLIVGLQTVHLNPHLSMEVLQALGNRMGVRHDPFRAEEPGKVLHELNRGELASSGETPYGPYYGSVDATALFLCLLHEVYRWTGDLVFCGAMYPFAKAAARHLMGQLRGPLGFLSYTGGEPPALRHQGWKDGEVGILRPDGRQPDPPVAPCEAQGYGYWGLRGFAEVAMALGEEDEAGISMAEAETLRERFHPAFWLSDEETYALALDGRGRRVRLVASNPGHLLMCGILTQVQADAVADRLFAEDMDSGWGVRTLSNQASYYDPSSYHHGSVWPHDNSLIAFGLARAGQGDRVAHVFEVMSASAVGFKNRIPELFGVESQSSGEGPRRISQACDIQAWAAGTPLLLIRALLGMEADAASKTLHLAAYLPPDVAPVEVQGVRLGSSIVSLHADGDGSVTQVDVRSQGGASVRVEGPPHNKG